ncbi:MAG: SDR family NAD(P)-dependent oxidoreductase [Sphingobium sp.]|uniref:SDR family NAD(P)-dependent oxidoreductase n=1 Tax=Sphingobium sp. TaxID=1912891 RepID=UPI002E20AF74
MGGRLEGLSAVVTGGASGMGRAIVDRFVAEGARVVLLDRNAERALDVVAQHGDAVRMVAGDVRSQADNRAAVAAAVAHGGGLDIFVANAGLWDWNARLIDLPLDATEAAFDELFAVNVKGYLLGAQAAARALADQGGSLIFTLSNAALYTNGGGPLYTASKHAALGLMRQLAFELAPRVRVNGVAIGGVTTDLRGPTALGQAEQSIALMPLAVAAPLVMPLARQPEAADFTGAYVMLADPQDGRAITGAVIEAHGGYGVRGVLKPAGGYDLDPAGDPTPAAMAQLQAIMSGAAAPEERA